MKNKKWKRENCLLIFFVKNREKNNDILEKIIKVDE
jgi:hypothetical protein